MYPNPDPEREPTTDPQATPPDDSGSNGASTAGDDRLTSGALPDSDPDGDPGGGPESWPGDTPPEAPPHGGPPPPTAPPAAGMPADSGEPAGPSSSPQRSTGKLLLVAGATALVTSLLVAPAAAVITTQVVSGQTIESSLDDDAGGGSAPAGDVNEVATETLPSVVSIEAGPGEGSGVVISSEGQILTNNHVAEAAAEDGEVTVQFEDGTEESAEIQGADPVSDLAVLEADGVEGLTPASFGDSADLEVGADVIAIGSPLGLSGSVTSGVVSAVERPVNVGLAEEPEGQSPFEDFEQFEDFEEQAPDPEDGPEAQTTTVIDAIQTDAPINPGNSGGPLMNSAGEVVGINTAIASTGGPQEAGSIGVGFAIPIDQAEPIIEELIDSGQASYAAIGATVTDADGGAGVVDVASDSAAAEADLENGDVITQVEDRNIPNADALIATVRSYSPGDTVTVTYERDGDTTETEMQLDAQSADSMDA